MARQATVVGSGPNGLSAAVALARAGYAVRVIEASDTIGGGVRTAELTLPGFQHDVGSAIHPAALSSPFFRAFGLRERIEWIAPELSYAHPILLPERARRNTLCRTHIHSLWSRSRTSLPARRRRPKGPRRHHGPKCAMKSMTACSGPGSWPCRSVR